MPLLTGASNFTISGNARLYEIHGDAIINHLPDSDERKKIQSIVSLPRTQASQKDYETRKKSGPCFPGTRKALLQEMMDWVTKPGESRMYVLSGLAGIGKSTVVYTLATQADELSFLAASFFFSRDEDDRKNAKRFFTTIAYQLCIYNEAFANAIGDTLLTERGSAATTKDPLEQLQVLILEPLRSIVQPHTQPILIIVDALDECDEDDEHAVFKGLCQLVRDLPPFKVILTTRPQPSIEAFLSSQGGHTSFRLQDIEDKVVDDDIRLYLNSSLSLDQTRKCHPHQQWNASEEEIDNLVRASGRLFIIASTAVRYILDKTASNPAIQIKKLLCAFDQARTPFKDLDHFYNIILRSVVPENCDDDHIVNRYQSIVGAIILVQHPLTVSTLAHLMNMDMEDICAVLDNLQSVILLGSDDVPRIYHKSFSDYLMDQARCIDPRLRIDSMVRHTEIATRCFEIMNKHLKYNIMGLGSPARFMNNKDGLKEDGVTDEQLDEKIPQQLRYACEYWVSHLKEASAKDIALIHELERFVNEHMLHWLELLSLIGKLDSAHRAIRVVLKLVQSTSSNLRQLSSDALRFISKFYEIIKRSALHTYYSALAFTPTDSLLYRRYNKETVDNICVIEGGPEKWDALVADLSHGEGVNVIKFSLDSSLFVSWSEQYVSQHKSQQGRLKIWNAATGTPISMIPGHSFAISNDFSTVASSEGGVISYYDPNGSTRGSVFTASSTILRLALSPESNRIAAALNDGTVLLWDSRDAELIDSFKDFEGKEFPYLQFSPTGARLAYSSSILIVKLRDGISGKFIADLVCGSHCLFEFSGNGSRVAALSYNYGLRLWNGESGALIDSVSKDVGHNHLAISANGSLLATADKSVKLWGENYGRLAQIKILEHNWPRSITFSADNVLAIAIESGIELYDVKTSFISTLPLNRRHKSLTFSPDCTRFAVADHVGRVHLWDIRGIGSGSFSNEKSKAFTALALSRDCSRLTCGFEDGTVELWETNPMTAAKQRISPLDLRSKIQTKIQAFVPPIFGLFYHKERVTTLGISPDGKLIVSGSDDKTIKLWNGNDGSLRATLKASGKLRDVALSNRVLAAGWNIWRTRRGGVTLWNLDTLGFIHTSNDLESVSTVSIAENSALVAVADYYRHVSLLDVVNKSIITTFNVPYTIHTMAFRPNNSHLVVQSDEGVVLSLNLIDKQIVEGPTLEHLNQLPNTPFWHGVPIWHCKDKEQHYFSALFPQHRNPVPVLWVPRQISVAAWTQGSSTIALGCNDGRVIFLRPLAMSVD